MLFSIMAHASTWHKSEHRIFIEIVLALATFMHFRISYKVTEVMNMGHCGAVVTNSPPTLAVSGSNPTPYVGKMVVSFCTEP